MTLQIPGLDLVALSKLIEAERKRLGLTQAALADRVSISRAAVGRAEAASGTAQHYIDILAALASAGSRPAYDALAATRSALMPAAPAAAPPSRLFVHTMAPMALADGRLAPAGLKLLVDAAADANTARLLRQGLLVPASAADAAIWERIRARAASAAPAAVW